MTLLRHLSHQKVVGEGICTESLVWVLYSLLHGLTQVLPIHTKDGYLYLKYLLELKNVKNNKKPKI